MESENRMKRLLSACLACVFFLSACAALHPPAVEQASYRNAGVVTQLYKTALAEQAPLIFLLGGGGKGGMAGSQKAIQRFNSLGYHVVSVGYFGLQGLPAYADRIDITEIHQAIVFYKNQTYVAPQKVLLHGFSLGAQLALLLASEYPADVNGVVALAPSHVVFQGGAISLFHHSSWTRDGVEVPYLPFDNFTLMAAVLSAIGTDGIGKSVTDEALQHKDAEQTARIKVERIAGPVLLVSGTRDQAWASTPMSEVIMARLDASRFAHKHIHLALDEGHAVPSHPQSIQAVSNFLTEFRQNNIAENPR